MDEKRIEKILETVKAIKELDIEIGILERDIEKEIQWCYDAGYDTAGGEFSEYGRNMCKRKSKLDWNMKDLINTLVNLI